MDAHNEDTCNVEKADDKSVWEAEVRRYLSHMPELYGTWRLPEGFLLNPLAGDEQDKDLLFARIAEPDPESTFENPREEVLQCLRA